MDLSWIQQLVPEPSMLSILETDKERFRVLAIRRWWWFNWQRRSALRSFSGVHHENDITLPRSECLMDKTTQE